ncbi:hypothetical protein HRbin12_00947 [bacterium HR12]|nr:hypothetical protein HRbin12_00947 [bacterium HR12]
MGWRRMSSVVGKLGKGRGAIVVTALGLLGLAAGLGVATATDAPEEAACDVASIRQRYAALEAKYEAMPEPSSPEEQYQRSQAFEREWTELGTLCEWNAPTAIEPPLGPEDAEWKLDHYGVGPVYPPAARPNLPGGFEVINDWADVVDGEPLVVSSVIRTTWSEGGGAVIDRTWGLLVQGVHGLGFFESPEAVGPLTIVDEHDLILTLEGPEGERFAFDVLRRQWVEPPAEAA